MEKQFRFNYEHYASLEALPEADLRLVREAERATANAHAPYSEFRVGAAARLRSGLILRGSNIESEVYPAGLCAERTLMFHAGANHPDDPIEALAIASVPSERECYPCGPVASTHLTLPTIDAVTNSAVTAAPHTPNRLVPLAQPNSRNTRSQ